MDKSEKKEIIVQKIEQLFLSDIKPLYPEINLSISPYDDDDDSSKISFYVDIDRNNHYELTFHYDNKMNFWSLKLTYIEYNKRKELHIREDIYHEHFNTRFITNVDEITNLVNEEFINPFLEDLKYNRLLLIQKVKLLEKNEEILTRKISELADKISELNIISEEKQLTLEEVLDIVIEHFDIEIERSQLEKKYKNIMEKN